MWLRTSSACGATRTFTSTYAIEIVGEIPRVNAFYPVKSVMDSGGLDSRRK